MERFIVESHSIRILLFLVNSRPMDFFPLFLFLFDERR